MIVKTLAPNEHGRDLVVGDLHGARHLLDRLLEGLRFDPTKDRLISVGDLIDRGPDSLGCLRLLDEPWFNAVLANHEQLMLAAFDGQPLGAWWGVNGGEWGEAALEAHQAQLAARRGELWALGREPSPHALEVLRLRAKVAELPYLITVQRPDGRRFHVLHAELPPLQEELTDEDLADPDLMAELVKVHDGRHGECVLWSRFIFGAISQYDLHDHMRPKLRRVVEARTAPISGMFGPRLSHIIGGHTILQRPTTILGQTCIDTGAYAAAAADATGWEALTCVDLGAWRFYQATERAFREVEPLDLNAD